MEEVVHGSMEEEAVGVGAAIRGGGGQRGHRRRRGGEVVHRGRREGGSVGSGHAEEDTGRKPACATTSRLWRGEQMVAVQGKRERQGRGRAVATGMEWSKGRGR